MFKCNEIETNILRCLYPYLSMKLFKPLFIVYIFCFLAVDSIAQNKVKGEIELKSGMILRGEILDVVYDDFVIIRLLNDTTQLEWDKIQSLDVFPQDPLPSKTQIIYSRKLKRPEQPYKAYSSYVTLDMANRFGIGRYFEMNPGLSLGLGYTIDSNFSVGTTVGVDFYWDNFTNIYPLGLEGTYRFNTKGFTPLLKLRAGYGVAQNRPSWWWNEVIEVEGGYFISPSIGLAGKRRDHSGWYINLNSMFTQTTERGFSRVWNGQDWIETPISRERIINRTGFVIGMYID